jgi:purine-binding chemotaxis protein CheW
VDSFIPRSRLQILHFQVQDMQLCVELKNVNKILPLALLQIVSNGPPYLAGLMNLSGKNIPVIDLAVKLGMVPQRTCPVNAPILVCENNFYQTGILVDKVIGVVDVDVEAQQMQKEFSEGDSLFLAAITVQAELVLLLNMKKVLAVELVSDGEDSLVANSVPQILN